MRPLRGQGRIVGGKKSKFGDWPWQVSRSSDRMLRKLRPGVGEGVDMAWAVHEEQVRRRSHLGSARPHCRPLSARVRMGGIKHFCVKTLDRLAENTETVASRELGCFT